MEEKKIKIIHAAAHLFSQKGYQSASVEEIAKESGMTKGSFYKHFPSKEDLLLQIFVLMRKDTENGLTGIYSRNYASIQEKLSDIVYITIHSMIFNQFHPLTLTPLDFQLIKNNHILKEIRQIQRTYTGWNQQIFLDLYGEEIRDYVRDLGLLLKGLITQYAQPPGDTNPVIELRKAAVFIAAVLDAAVKRIVESKPDPVLKMEELAGEIETESDSPLLKGQRIQMLLTQMEQTIKSVKIGINEREEYLNTLSLLREESALNKSKPFLLRALLNYLQEIPKLRNDCAVLRSVLDIE